MNGYQEPPYPENRGTTASSYPQEFMENYHKPLKPWHGILIFAVMMLMMIFVAAPLQYAFGMLGLVLTELMLLIIAVAGALILRQNLKEVFPIGKPRLRFFFGTLLTWAGVYLLAMLASLILMYFFPEGFLDVSNNMNSIFSTTPFPVTFFIVAIMPAVCEESIHRGLIQYTFRNVKNSAAVILCIGILFGIFHLDPYRFLTTAILGMGLAFLMIRTQNLFYPALFHFINNALSVLVSGGETASQELSPDLYTKPMFLVCIGVYLIFGAIAPFCLLGASRLLRRPGEPKKGLLLPILLISLLAGLMIVVGFSLLIFTLLQNPTLGISPETVENLLAAWIL